MKFKLEHSSIESSESKKVINKVRIETTSQLIRFGHWFTLFNMIVAILIGSRYFFIADWPPTLLGRIYAMMSCVGHFGFITFLAYLIFIFPFSFVLRSIKWLQIISVLIFTIGILFLLMDLTVFSMFKIHLNWQILDLLISSESGELYNRFERIFIFLPLIVVIEIFAAVWIWKRLRSLTKRKKYIRPFVWFWLFCFCAFHLFHIWADVNFYRPITMQRQSLPLYSPLTARSFLIQIGALNEQKFEIRQQKYKNESNSIDKMRSIEYPLGKITTDEKEQKMNILLIGIKNWRGDLQDYPNLTAFAEKHSQFENHYSTSFNPHLSEFALFYGLDPNYYQTLMANKQTSVLNQTLIEQHYKQSELNDSNQSIQNQILKQIDLIKKMKDMDVKEGKADSVWFNSLLLDMNQKINQAEFDEMLSNLLEQASSQENTMVIFVGLNPVNKTRDQQALIHRQNLKVPLIVAMPNKAAEKISYPTTHIDILVTMMKNALQVKNSSRQFSNGKNLFDPNKRSPIVVGDFQALVAYFPENTLLILDQNKYFSYDLTGDLKSNNRLTTARYLSVLSENRHFIVRH